MSKWLNTVAVVRSFNDPNIAEFLKKFSEVVPAIIVVTDEVVDKGKTWGLVQATRPHLNCRVEVVSMMTKCPGRSWSAMLNAGLQHVQGMKSMNRPFRYLFNVSNTTEFTYEHLDEMLREFEKSIKIGIVGTTFRGYNTEGQPVQLGKSYNTFCRNTGMIIDLNVFDHCPELCCFDPFYDEGCGMEDYAFVMTARRFGWVDILLDLQVPLIVNRHWDQDKKDVLMEEGIQIIDKRLAETAKT